MRVIGRTKPKGAMRVKARFCWLRADPFGAQARDLHAPSRAVSTKSIPVGTRKMVNYAWPG